MSTKKRTGEDALFESGLSDEVIFYGMVEALFAEGRADKDVETILLGEWNMNFSPFYAMFRFRDSLFGSDFWSDRESEYRNDGVEEKVWVGDAPKIIGQLARKLTPAEITRLPAQPLAPLPPREKCYIAGAIGSMAEAEYRPLFEAGAAEARTLGFEPILPIGLPHNHDRSYGSYMKEDLTELLKCKAIYVLRNWRHSPGAKFEIETAVFCGINVIFQ